MLFCLSLIFLIDTQRMQLQIIYSRVTGQERRICFKCCLFLAFCSLLTFYSCDDSFQPIKENNRYNFNISGYLDASADTQWVRVGTIRGSIDELPNPEGIQVTVKNLQTGESVIMKDSVFTSRSVLNYWTTMEIENEHTYNITAERNDGKSSQVTVTIPMNLPTVYVNVITPAPIETRIYINDSIEHIADIQSVWYVILNPETENRKRVYRFPIRNTLRHTSSFFGSYYASANWEEEEEHIKQSVGAAEIKVASRQFFVAAGGPEWNDSLSTIDDLEYFIDGTASNVENGLGYVVGISSAWYQQVTCLNSDRSGYAPCQKKEPFW